jgi:hypothetical protein
MSALFIYGDGEISTFITAPSEEALMAIFLEIPPAVTVK